MADSPNDSTAHESKLHPSFNSALLEFAQNAANEAKPTRVTQDIPGKHVSFDWSNPLGNGKDGQSTHYTDNLAAFALTLKNSPELQGTKTGQELEYIWQRAKGDQREFGIKAAAFLTGLENNANFAGEFKTIEPAIERSIYDVTVNDRVRNPFKRGAGDLAFMLYPDSTSLNQFMERMGKRGPAPALPNDMFPDNPQITPELQEKLRNLWAQGSRQADASGHYMDLGSMNYNYIPLEGQAQNIVRYEMAIKQVEQAAKDNNITIGTQMQGARHNIILTGGDESGRKAVKSLLMVYVGRLAVSSQQSGDTTVLNLDVNDPDRKFDGIASTSPELRQQAVGRVNTMRANEMRTNTLEGDLKNEARVPRFTGKDADKTFGSTGDEGKDDASESLWSKLLKGLGGIFTFIGDLIKGLIGGIMSFFGGGAETPAPAPAPAPDTTEKTEPEPSKDPAKIAKAAEKIADITVAPKGDPSTLPPPVKTNQPALSH